MPLTLQDRDDPGTVRRSRFEVLAVEHLPALKRRARRLAPAAADDLVQETLLRAWVRFERYTPGTNAWAWLGRILTLVWLEDRRRSQFARGAGAGPSAAGRGALDPAVAITVRNSVRQLPPAVRTVVWLIDLEDHSYREAAGRLGVPIGTVMSRLHRGRLAIRSALSNTSRKRHM